MRHVLVLLIGSLFWVACNKGLVDYCNEILDLSCRKSAQCWDGGAPEYPFKTRSECLDTIRELDADAGRSCESRTEEVVCGRQGLVTSKAENCLTDLKAKRCEDPYPASCTESFCGP